MSILGKTRLTIVSSLAVVGTCLGCVLGLPSTASGAEVDGDAVASVVGDLTLVSRTLAGHGVSQWSESPDMSSDGRYLAYSTADLEVVSQGNPAGTDQAYLYDAVSGRTRLVSRTDAGVGGRGSSLPTAVSLTGKVLFTSSAPNLALSVAAPTGGNYHVYLESAAEPDLQMVDRRVGGATPTRGAYVGSMSRSGRYVAFVTLDDQVAPGDANAQGDIALTDLVTRTTWLASGRPDGTQRYDRAVFLPDVTANGGSVDFLAFAGSMGSVALPGHTDDLTLYRYNRSTGTVRPLILDAGRRVLPVSDYTVSDDGKVVAFTTAAALVARDTNDAPDVYLRHLATGRTTWLSAGAGSGDDPLVASNGACVAFLTPNGTYLHTVETGVTEVVQVGRSGDAVSRGLFPFGISSDCTTIGMTSTLPGLVAQTVPDSVQQVYLWSRR